MDVLFTRDGKALGVSGRDVFDRTGTQIARRHEDRLHGPDGTYLATVIGERVVYRGADNICVTLGFAPRTMAPTTIADRPRAALRGEEPFRSNAVTEPARPAVPSAAFRAALPSMLADMILARET